VKKPKEIVTDAAPIELDIHHLDVWKGEMKLRDWEGDTFTFVCCDCFLVHRVGVMRDKHTGKTLILMSRNDRSTAQYRRHKDGGLHRGVGKWRMIRNENSNSDTSRHT